MTRNNTNLMGDAGLAGLSSGPKPQRNGGQELPEVTVAMPAYNAAAYIEKAIASVLCQRGIHFELIVVDDGSEDDTGEKVRNFKDPRIRFYRNEKNRGIGFCHNLIIEFSRASFITHVDADDAVLRPDALAKMVHRVRSSERIGQAHCYRVRIDARGRVSRDAFLAMRERELEIRPSSVDYRRNLLVYGSVNNSLRTYRKEVFSRVGLFDEGLKRGVDYHMALRVVDRFEIAVVPELLYAVRKHGRNTSELSYFRNFRYWCDRVFVCQKLLNQGMISFPREKRYDKNRLLLQGLWEIVRSSRVVSGFKALRRIPRVGKTVAARVWDTLKTGIYGLMVRHLGWWPLTLFPRPRRAAQAAPERLAVYLWHFPTLSETFVQREVTALEKAGFAVVPIADGHEGTEHLDSRGLGLMEQTRYLFPIDPAFYERCRRDFSRHHPLRTVNLLVYVIAHRYGFYKTFREDLFVFRTAVCLAGALKNEGITHLHLAWADRCAFVGMAAAYLLGIEYSIRARAHELYRYRQRYALREKFVHAAFVVTNSRYNEAYIRKTLGERSNEVRIETVYEGVDLERFSPRPRPMERENRPLTILSVARLVEEKGLVFLLRACRLLLHRDSRFQCIIIGGTELPAYTDYYLTLKKLHKSLGLEECVCFLGAQPFQAVLKHYQKSDLFVLPCVVAKNGGRDITPNSILEAMAMELPVVSTTTGAIGEIVEDGVSGLLVAPNDEYALSRAIERLAADPELRRRLGENGRSRVETKFDIEKNGAELVRLFRSPGTV